VVDVVVDEGSLQIVWHICDNTIVPMAQIATAWCNLWHFLR